MGSSLHGVIARVSTFYCLTIGKAVYVIHCASFWTMRPHTTKNFLVGITSSTLVSYLPLNPSSFEKQYDKLETVYYRRTKHLKVCVKISAWLFNTVFGVLGNSHNSWLGWGWRENGRGKNPIILAIYPPLKSKKEYIQAIHAVTFQLLSTFKSKRKWVGYKRCFHATIFSSPPPPPAINNDWSLIHTFWFFSRLLYITSHIFFNHF